MKSPNKYWNKKSGGYDSKKEQKRAWELKLLEKSGEILGLEEKRRFELIPKQEGERAVCYESDFSYYTLEAGAPLVVEDVKSEMTRKLPVYIVNRKLMLWVHKIKIREV